MKITYHYDKKNLNTIGSIDFGSMQDFRKGYEEALRMKGLTDSVSLNVVLRAMLIIDPKPPVPVRLVISDDAKGDLITTDKLLGIKPKQVCTLPEMSLEEPIDSLHTNLYNYAMEIVWQDYANHTQVTFPSTQAQCKSLIIQRMNPEKIGLPAIWWAGLGFSSCLIITLMLL